MTRDEIIRMAREAGGFEDRDDGVPYCMWLFTPQELEKFAASVIAKEREACAKLCDELAELNRSSPTDSLWQWGECAAAIRARSKA